MVVGRQSTKSISIVVAEGSTEGGNGDSQDRGGRDNGSPSLLSVFNSLFKERVEEEILKVCIRIKRFFDSIKELSTNDAPTSPQQRCVTVIKLPFVLGRSSLELNKTLSVAHDFRGIQSLSHRLNKILSIAYKRSGRRR